LKLQLQTPPRHNITNADFQNYFSTFSNNFIIGGDYNAKHQNWGCRTNNKRGLILQQNFTNSKQFKVLASPSPTYWLTSCSKNPDILDIFITKNPSNLYCTIHNLLDIHSDHSSVILIINDYPPIHQGVPKLFYSTTDRCKFHN